MKWRLLSSGQSVNRFFSYLEKEIRKWQMIRRKLLRQPYLQNSSSHRRKCYRVCVHARHSRYEKRSRAENQRLHGKCRMKTAKNDCAACRKCSGRRQNLSSGAFRSEFPFGSGLGQTEKSQNSPSEKVLKTQKNPAEIERFQPDLVGVSGFEPEASWSRTKRDTKLRHTPSAWILYVENSDLSRGMHENIFGAYACQRRCVR